MLLPAGGDDEWVIRRSVNGHFCPARGIPGIDLRHEPGRLQLVEVISGILEGRVDRLGQLGGGRRFLIEFGENVPRHLRGECRKYFVSGFFIVNVHEPWCLIRVRVGSKWE
jgi:hypothetical protein